MKVCGFQIIVAIITSLIFQIILGVKNICAVPACLNLLSFGIIKTIIIFGEIEKTLVFEIVVFFVRSKMFEYSDNYNYLPVNNKRKKYFSSFWIGKYFPFLVIYHNVKKRRTASISSLPYKNHTLI